MKKEGSPAKLARSRATSKTRQQETKTGLAAEQGGGGVELPANRSVIPLNNVLTVINLVLSVGVADPAWTLASSVLSSSSLFLGGTSLYSVCIKQPQLVTLIALTAWCWHTNYLQHADKYHFFCRYYWVIVDMYCSICMIYYITSMYIAVLICGLWLCLVNCLYPIPMVFHDQHLVHSSLCGLDL